MNYYTHKATGEQKFINYKLIWSSLRVHIHAYPYLGDLSCYPCEQIFSSRITLVWQKEHSAWENGHWDFGLGLAPIGWEDSRKPLHLPQLTLVSSFFPITSVRCNWHRNKLYIFKLYNFLSFMCVYICERACQINTGYSVKFEFQVNIKLFFSISRSHTGFEFQIKFI